MTGLLDEQTGVNIVYLDLRQVFNTVSHKNLREADEVWVGWAVNEVN